MHIQQSYTHNQGAVMNFRQNVTAPITTMPLAGYADQSHKIQSPQGVTPTYSFKTKNSRGEKMDLLEGTRTVSNYIPDSSTYTQESWNNLQSTSNNHNSFLMEPFKTESSKQDAYFPASIGQKEKQVKNDHLYGGSDTFGSSSYTQPSISPTGHEALFGRYAAGDHSEDGHSKYQAFLKQKMQATSGSYMSNYYQSLVERPSTRKDTLIRELSDKNQSNVAKEDSSALQVIPSQGSSLQAQRSQEDSDENRSKVSELRQEVTNLGFEKNELILEVAQLSRENSQLRKVNEQLKGQIETHKETLENTIKAYKEKEEEQNSKGVFLQFQLIAEIENIRERETELSKLKKQFMAVLEDKYLEEMKRLASQNNLLKTELSNIKYQLEAAKEAVKDKQSKIDFMQKENDALESKSDKISKTFREKADWQVGEKDKQIQALKHSLAAIEKQYRAQRKEIADKDEFIMKYMAGTGEDVETVQLILQKYNFYSRKQFEQSSKGK